MSHPDAIETLGYNFARGIAKSIPLAGAFLEQYVFGTLDANARASEARKLNDAMQAVQKDVQNQRLTLTELVQQLKNRTSFSESTEVALRELQAGNPAAVRRLEEHLRQVGLELSGFVGNPSNSGTVASGNPDHAYLDKIIRHWESEWLSVHYIKRGGRIENSETLIRDLDDWAFARSNEPDAGTVTLLLGEYGSGKSSLISRVACQLAKARLEGLGTCVPAIVLLRRGILDAVHRDFCRGIAEFTNPRAHHHMLDQHLVAGDLCLLLDGLDELLATYHESERNAIVRSLLGTPVARRCNVFITCRTHVFVDPGAVSGIRSEMQGLTLERVADRAAVVVRQLLGSEPNVPASHQQVVCAELSSVSEPECDRYLYKIGEAASWKDMNPHFQFDSDLSTFRRP